MYSYRIFDLFVASDFKMDGGLQCDAEKKADVIIQQKEMKPFEVELTEEQRENPYTCFYNHQEHRSDLHFPFQGDFIVEDGRKITYSLKEHAEKDYIEQVFLCFCMTVILVQRGVLILHGSAIEWNGKAVVISGDSGAGKSTLTNYLLEKNRKFLSDDVVPLYMESEIMAGTSFPTRKLCEDAVIHGGYDKSKLRKIPDPEREKYLIRCDEQFIQKRCPFFALIVVRVDNVSQVTLQEITGSEKIKYVTQNLFRLDMYDFIGLNQKRFLQCVKIANTIRIFSLTRPEGKMTVEDQAELLEQVLK